MLKNTSESQPGRPDLGTSLNLNHKRGLECELKVARHFKLLNYKIVGQRFKTPFAEVDLLLEGDDHYLMVEVKSCSSLSFANGKLRARQKARLQRAFIYLAEQLNKPLQASLAFVVDDELHILEDVLG